MFGMSQLAHIRFRKCWWIFCGPSAQQHITINVWTFGMVTKWREKKKTEFVEFRYFSTFDYVSVMSPLPNRTSGTTTMRLNEWNCSTQRWRQTVEEGDIEREREREDLEPLVRFVICDLHSTKEQHRIAQFNTVSLWRTYFSSMLLSLSVSFLVCIYEKREIVPNQSKKKIITNKHSSPTFQQHFVFSFF